MPLAWPSGTRTASARYEHQIFEVGGLGFRVFHTDTQELNLEAGVGATQSDAAGWHADNNEVVGRLGADYHWHISETPLFSEMVSSTMGVGQHLHRVPD